MTNETGLPKKESVAESLKKYKAAHDANKDKLAAIPGDIDQPLTPQQINEIQNRQTGQIPSMSQPSPEYYPGAIADNIPAMPMQKFNQSAFEANMSRETDPDLMMSYEVVKLPSGGLHYRHGISEVNVEYMTSVDEDLLTTPSLIENGTVLDILLKRKIKTPGITVDELLPGDRNAIILFLRTSSYGPSYNVQVPDPRNNVPFKTTVDLTQLKYKEIQEKPDRNGHFNVYIKMRKKTVTFRLLSGGDENRLEKKAEAIKEAYGTEFSEYNTMKLKAHIVSIDDKTDRMYIDKFINVMPSGDAFTIRKKIAEVSPDVDMKYEFTTSDGYKFFANLTVGIDFFFPNT